MGYVQTGVFLVAAEVLFNVPFTGSPVAFFVGFNIYVVVNLAIGFLISTLVRTQMQAMQASFMLLLPTILLSGFMFPFAGMPGWAQAIGTVIPATHFLRLVRKVMLKSAEMTDVLGDIRAMIVIGFVIVLVSLLRYRQTLD
ncbi:MAG: ABC transporter permease [Maritimibacter sp.]